MRPKSSHSELPKYFSERAWLQRLLIVEKRRRNVSEASLVFVGMHNVSQYWWCGMYSIIKSRHNEVDFFGAYIKDRVAYSLLTGRNTKIPKKQQDLLEVGSDLSVKDIEEFSKQQRVFNTNERNYHKRDAKRNDAFSKLEFTDYLDQGLMNELKLSESYSSYRWNFPYKKYVLIGIPDGITKKFVSEFKSTSRRFFSLYQKCVAQTQADFYGYFFQRKTKRVQIFIEEDETIETLETPVDLSRVKETIQKFESVDNGTLPQPPAKWKCKSCEFRHECDICQT